MRLASRVTLSAVVFLIILKLMAWYMTESVSLLSSLVDSCMDFMASMVNFIAIRYAVQPPDDDHRFGHGKAEYIASMGQASFIAVTAMVVAIEAVLRFKSPVLISHSDVGIGVMAISLMVTVGMVRFQRYVMKKTGSTAVGADAAHYITDILSNAAVILTFIVVGYTGWHWADPVIALFIAAYILHGAWEVAKESFDHLMDKEFNDAEREEIVRVILAQQRVLGVHELKTRRSGLLSFIQCHVDLDARMSLHDAHEIAETIETAVQKLHPHAEVLIHMDPITP